jgi:hypothetical protein
LLERADLVTRGDHGQGVVELIERLLANDLVLDSPEVGKVQGPFSGGKIESGS